MSEATVIRVIQKNARESVRVALDQFHNIDLLDIRILAHGDDGAEPQLTKKGIAIRVGKIAELIEALQEAQAEAVRRGLIGKAA